MPGLGKFPPFPAPWVEADASEVGGDSAETMTSYPVGWPYDYEQDPLDLFLPIYRVKKFRIQASASGMTSGSVPVPYSNSFDVTYDLGEGTFVNDPTPGFTTEKDMVRYQGPALFISREVVGGQFIQAFVYSHPFRDQKVVDNLYYPDIILWLQGPVGPVLGVGGARINPGVFSALFEGTFLGRPCPYYLFDTLDAFNTFTVDSSSFSVTAAEYWEYDPGDGGGPIWDSATGEQIRNRWDVQQWQ